VGERKGTFSTTPTTVYPLQRVGDIGSLPTEAGRPVPPYNALILSADFAFVGQKMGIFEDFSAAA